MINKKLRAFEKDAVFGRGETCGAVIIFQDNVIGFKNDMVDNVHAWHVHLYGVSIYRVKCLRYSLTLLWTAKAAIPFLNVIATSDSSQISLLVSPVTDIIRTLAFSIGKSSTKR